MTLLKDSHRLSKNFPSKAIRPLQPPRGWISQQHIEKKMKYWTDSNLQKFIALIKRI
jgi:hypothetical protein